MAADVVTAVGLYMVGYYIQTDYRDWVDRETGEKKEKCYVTVAAGKSTRGGSVNVSIPATEYDALEEKFADGSLKVGSALLLPLEAFGYKDKAYFRAVGPISMLQEPVAVEVSV